MLAKEKDDKELASIERIRRELLRSDVDFGTYHHTTPEESSNIRQQAAEGFVRAMSSSYPSGARIDILDAGCGLGFVTYVASKYFGKSRVTGVDLFKDESLSDMSIEKASKNMRKLKVSSRTSFLIRDLTRPLGVHAHFDLAVSNLVFHNIGRNKPKAYRAIYDVLKPGGFFIIGDLWGKGSDVALSAIFTHVDQFDYGRAGRWKYQIKVLRKP